MSIDSRFMLSKLDFYIEHLVAYLDEGLPVAVARARAAAVTEGRIRRQRYK